MTEEVRFILSADDTKANAALKRTEDNLRRVGSATAYTKQQMQNLSFQMTDIVAGLATGQSPFYVLLQQGGQLKDTFGGVGGAVKAVASVFTLARVAAVGMAGGLGLVATAAFQGWQESNRLRDSLALTGNFAGLTEGSFRSLTERIAESTNTTVGSAREITQALAATGRIGGPALETVARAAALVQDVSGDAAADVVKDFARMSQGVVKWAAEHNESWHFVSAAQLEYIRQLEEQGRKEAAMVAVGQAVLDHHKDRQRELTIEEKQWRLLGQAASWAWGQMRGALGKQSTEERLAAVQGRLADWDKAGPQYRNTPAAQREIAGLLGSQGTLNRDLLAQFNGSATSAAAAIASREDIERREKLRLVTERLSGANSEYAKTLKTIQEAAAAGDITEERRLELLTQAATQFGAGVPRKAKGPAADRPFVGPPTYDEQYAQFFRNFPAPNVAGIIGSASAGSRFRQDEAGSADSIEAALLERNQLEVEAQRELLQLMKPEWQKLAEAWEDTSTRMAEVGRQFTDGFVDAGRDAFAEFMRTGRLSMEGFRGLVIQTLTQLVYDRVIAKQMGELGNMLWNYISAGMSGGGFGFGGGGSSTGGQTGMDEYAIGTRASGGPVSAGRTYLVGEQGPELLRMGGSGGYVVPNHQMRGAGGLNISMPIYLSVGQGVGRSEVAAAMRSATDAAIGRIRSEVLRGGRLWDR